MPVVAQVPWQCWLRNGVQPGRAALTGAAWPTTPTWDCRTPEQRANLSAAAAALAVEPAGCLPSDHAGVVATVTLPASSTRDAPLVDRSTGGLPPLAWLGMAILTAVLIATVPALVLAGAVAAVTRRSGPRPPGP